MSSYRDRDREHGGLQLGTSKPRSKVVKPILRKLTQSETNSLDLDRTAAEQDGLGIYDYDYGNNGNGNVNVIMNSGNGTGSRSSHDVPFNSHGQVPGRRGYHNRSTSGTSQFSTATTGSGHHRTGSFVHPFQQTPRPYTPPIASSSYQNSLRESDHSTSNSPAVAEDEDHLRQNLRSTSNLSNHSPSLSTAPSPIIPQPALRIHTKASSSKLALATSSTSVNNYLSPLSPDLISPVDTMTPISAIRESIDKGFRLRSRSEVVTNNYYHVDHLAEARRKFAEKEARKDEKAAREEVRKLEKRNIKEAQKVERAHRRSFASERSRSHRSKSDLTMQSEKGGVYGTPYANTSPQYPHLYNDFEEMPRRSLSNTAKHKTLSTWTKFVMWFRTRIIRLSKGTGSYQK